MKFWSPDLTLCLTKASIKIMTSLKIIIIITIHVIIVINCASMKLQVKFKQHIITFQTFWLKTGGRGTLIPVGVLIGRRALNQIIATCKQFCCHYLMKVAPVYHLQLEEDSKDQTDSPWSMWSTWIYNFQDWKSVNMSQKTKLQRHLWIKINLLYF